MALERHFRWSRTLLSGAFSLSRAEGALLGPVEGLLTDRFGSRRMVIIGFTVLGAGFVGLSLINSVVGFYVAFLVINAGAGLGSFVPMMTAINHWFVRRRSLATSIGLTGLSLGGLLVPVMAWAVTYAGWRLTARAIGIAIWALAMPIAVLVRNKPEEYGLRPDGDAGDVRWVRQTSSIRETGVSESFDFTVAQALRTRAFWAIALCHSSGAIASTTIAIHIIPALTDAGMSLRVAGAVVAAYTVIGLVTQLLGGFLGDRLPKPLLISVFTALQGMGVMVLAYATGMGGTILFSMLFGIGFGGRVPLLIALRGEYFGRRAFGGILGISMLPMNIGSIAAPILTGYFYDTQGTYVIPFVGLAVLNFLGATLILLARKPAFPGSPEHGESQKTVG